MIVHVCGSDAWTAARTSGMYRPESLGSEGFIHFSRWDQLAGTVERYYSGVSDLVVLVVEPGDLPFRVENGFPHLYGELPLSAVVEVMPLAEALERAAER